MEDEERRRDGVTAIERKTNVFLDTEGRWRCLTDMRPSVSEDNQFQFGLLAGKKALTCGEDPRTAGNQSKVQGSGNSYLLLARYIL